MDRIIPAVLACFALSAFPSFAHASAIFGGWYATDAGPSHSTGVFVFLSNGEYVEVQDGNSALDPSGHNGMERGAYSWNPATGAFSSNTLLDTDGEWGLSNIACSVSVSVTGNALHMLVPCEGITVDFAKVADPASPIVSSWYFTNNPEPGDLTVLTFLPNGKYLIAIDPPATGFMVYGDYTWDSLSGALSLTPIDSTVPLSSPFSGLQVSSATLQGGSLVLQSNLGSITLADASAPEPASLALVSLGIAGLGWSRHRRR